MAIEAVGIADTRLECLPSWPPGSAAMSKLDHGDEPFRPPSRDAARGCVIAGRQRREHGAVPLSIEEWRGRRSWWDCSSRHFRGSAEWPVRPVVRGLSCRNGQGEHLLGVFIWSCGRLDSPGSEVQVAQMAVRLEPATGASGVSEATPSDREGGQTGDRRWSTIKRQWPAALCFAVYVVLAMVVYGHFGSLGPGHMTGNL